MSDDRVTVRLDEPAKAALGDLIDSGADSKADAIRQAVQFAAATQGGAAADVADIERRLDESIEVNRKRRRIARFPTETVRELFKEDITADVDRDDLRAFAAGYREQAEMLEELAQEIPNAPPIEPGELVDAVDRELHYALEAEDLSAWGDEMDNPHENLGGVKRGRSERKAVVSMVQQAVEASNQQLRGVRALPPMAESVLPDDTDAEQVVEVANRMIAQGVDADDVPDMIPTVDPDLLPVEVESEPVDEPGDDDRDDDQGDDEPAKDELPEDATIMPNANPDYRTPERDLAADQGELPVDVPTPDGGRSADADAWRDDDEVEDDNMSESQPLTDDDDEDVTEQFDEIMAGHPANAEGGR